MVFVMIDSSDFFYHHASLENLELFEKKSQAQHGCCTTGHCQMMNGYYPPVQFKLFLQVFTFT